MRREYEEFRGRDAVVIVVGPENGERFRAYWTQHELPFVGLSDEKHKVLKLYGQEVKIFKLGRQPAQMLIDKQGMLRYIHYGHSMGDIPSNEEVLALIDGML